MALGVQSCTTICVVVLYRYARSGADLGSDPRPMSMQGRGTKVWIAAMDGWLRTMTHPGSLDVEMASPGVSKEPGSLGAWTCLAGDPGISPLQ